MHIGGPVSQKHIAAAPAGAVPSGARPTCPWCDTWSVHCRNAEAIGHQPYPRRIRNSRRDVIPSLAKILLRCHSTVRGLMNRCPAISELV